METKTIGLLIYIWCILGTAFFVLIFLSVEWAKVNIYKKAALILLSGPVVYCIVPFIHCTLNFYTLYRKFTGWLEK